MTPTRSVRVLMLLAFVIAGCEKDPPTTTASPAGKASQPAKKPKAKPATKTSASPAASASAATPDVKAPTRLAEGSGLGKLIALHDDYVYWTVRPGASCVGSADNCKSASDGSIWRVPKDGGIPNEVVGSLRNVSSLAFNDGDVLWTMCGSVDYVQRCQVTSVPAKGGKRNLLFDAGPELVQNVVWAKDRAIWAVPSKKELHQKQPGHDKPAALSPAGEITDLAARGNELFWTTGQPVGNDGAVHRIDVEKAEPVELARERSAPQHIAVDDTHAYWVEAGEAEGGKPEQVIARVGIGGGEPQIVVRGLSYVEDIALSGDKVVFATDHGVSWAPKAGGKERMLTPKLSSPHGPAVDEKHAYWIADDKVWRVELPE